MDYDSKYFKGKVLALEKGGTTLQWTKNVVKNIVFQSCVFELPPSQYFKIFFIKYIKNKVVQY